MGFKLNWKAKKIPKRRESEKKIRSINSSFGLEGLQNLREYGEICQKKKGRSLSENGMNETEIMKQLQLPVKTRSMQEYGYGSEW